MKKEKMSKVKHYFTLSENIHEIFSKHVEDNAISKPKLIEMLIIQYLKKNNININD